MEYKSENERRKKKTFSRIRRTEDEENSVELLSRYPPLGVCVCICALPAVAKVGGERIRIHGSGQLFAGRSSGADLSPGTAIGGMGNDQGINAVCIMRCPLRGSSE